MNEQPTITLGLTIGETQIVLQALSKLPFEQVADTWFKVKNTAEQQLAAAPQPAPAEPHAAGGTD